MPTCAASLAAVACGLETHAARTRVSWTRVPQARMMQHARSYMVCCEGPYLRGCNKRVEWRRRRGGCGGGGRAPEPKRRRRRKRHPCLRQALPRLKHGDARG
jgi:hypothetical protein